MHCEVTAGSLEFNAKRSLASYLGVPEEAILTRSNSAKYAPSCQDDRDHARLGEIFELMASLNRTAIEDAEIGASASDRTGLRDLLTIAAREIRLAFPDGRFHWVELGPEPIKTSHLLRSLADAGAAPLSYTAVDINPTSAEMMTGIVESIVPGILVRALTADYDHLDPSIIHPDDSPLVITNLGFQEGNDTPARTDARLTRLAQSGDFVLAEMQVIPTNSLDEVKSFYALPEMRRFSEITARSLVEERLADYTHFIIPVDVGLEAPVFAAICAHRVEHGPVAASSADPKTSLALVMTNVCIKPTAEQFRSIREHSGRFVVVWQSSTGDRTVAVQLARRR